MLIGIETEENDIEVLELGKIIQQGPEPVIAEHKLRQQETELILAVDLYLKQIEPTTLPIQLTGHQNYPITVTPNKTTLKPTQPNFNGQQVNLTLKLTNA